MARQCFACDIQLAYYQTQFQCQLCGNWLCSGCHTLKVKLDQMGQSGPAGSCTSCQLVASMKSSNSDRTSESNRSSKLSGSANKEGGQSSTGSGKVTELGTREVSDAGEELTASTVKPPQSYKQQHNSSQPHSSGMAAKRKLENAVFNTEAGVTVAPHGEVTSALSSSSKPVNNDTTELSLQGIEENWHGEMNVNPVLKKEQCDHGKPATTVNGRPRQLQQQTDNLASSASHATKTTDQSCVSVGPGVVGSAMCESSGATKTLNTDTLSRTSETATNFQSQTNRQMSWQGGTSKNHNDSDEFGNHGDINNQLSQSWHSAELNSVVSEKTNARLLQDDAIVTGSVLVERPEPLVLSDLDNQTLTDVDSVFPSWDEGGQESSAIKRLISDSGSSGDVELTQPGASHVITINISDGDSDSDSESSHSSCSSVLHSPTAASSSKPVDEEPASEVLVEGSGKQASATQLATSFPHVETVVNPDKSDGPWGNDLEVQSFMGESTSQISGSPKLSGNRKEVIESDTNTLLKGNPDSTTFLTDTSSKSREKERGAAGSPEIVLERTTDSFYKSSYPEPGAAKAMLVGHKTSVEQPNDVPVQLSNKHEANTAPPPSAGDLRERASKTALKVTITDRPSTEPIRPVDIPQNAVFVADKETLYVGEVEQLELLNINDTESPVSVVPNPSSSVEQGQMEDTNTDSDVEVIPAEIPQRIFCKKCKTMHDVRKLGTVRLIHVVSDDFSDQLCSGLGQSPDDENNLCDNLTPSQIAQLAAIRTEDTGSSTKPWPSTQTRGASETRKSMQEKKANSSKKETSPRKVIQPTLKTSTKQVPSGENRDGKVEENFRDEKMFRKKQTPATPKRRQNLEQVWESLEKGETAPTPVGTSGRGSQGEELLQEQREATPPPPPPQQNTEEQTPENKRPAESIPVPEQSKTSPGPDPQKEMDALEAAQVMILMANMGKMYGKKEEGPRPSSSFPPWPSAGDPTAGAGRQALARSFFQTLLGGADRPQGVDETPGPNDADAQAARGGSLQQDLTKLLAFVQSRRQGQSAAPAQQLFESDPGARRSMVQQMLGTLTKASPWSGDPGQGYSPADLLMPSPSDTERAKEMMTLLSLMTAPNPLRTPGLDLTAEIPDYATLCNKDDPKTKALINNLLDLMTTPEPKCPDGTGETKLVWDSLMKSFRGRKQIAELLLTILLNAPDAKQKPSEQKQQDTEQDPATDTENDADDEQEASVCQQEISAMLKDIDESSKTPAAPAFEKAVGDMNNSVLNFMLEVTEMGKAKKKKKPKRPPQSVSPPAGSLPISSNDATEKQKSGTVGVSQDIEPEVSNINVLPEFSQTLQPGQTPVWPSSVLAERGTVPQASAQPHSSADTYKQELASRNTSFTSPDHSFPSSARSYPFTDVSFKVNQRPLVLGKTSSESGIRAKTPKTNKNAVVAKTSELKKSYSSTHVPAAVPENRNQAPVFTSEPPPLPSQPPPVPVKPPRGNKLPRQQMGATSESEGLWQHNPAYQGAPDRTPGHSSPVLSGAPLAEQEWAGEGIAAGASSNFSNQSEWFGVESDKNQSDLKQRELKSNQTPAKNITTSRKVRGQVSRRHRPSGHGSHDLHEILCSTAESLDLYVYDVPSDGNCMFRAVVDQLRMMGNFKYTHKTLRQAAVKYLRENPFHEDGTHKDNFLTNESWELYLQRMSNNCEWGEHLVLSAIVEMLECRIRVVTVTWEGSSENVIEPTSCQPDPTHLLNIGLQGEYHFESLRQYNWEEPLIENAKQQVVRKSKKKAGKKQPLAVAAMLAEGRHLGNRKQKDCDDLEKDDSEEEDIEAIQNYSSAQLLVPNSHWDPLSNSSMPHLSYLLRLLLTPDKLEVMPPDEACCTDSDSDENSDYGTILQVGPAFENLDVIIKRNRSYYCQTHKGWHNSKCQTSFLGDVFFIPQDTAVIVGSQGTDADNLSEYDLVPDHTCCPPGFVRLLPVSKTAWSHQLAGDDDGKMYLKKIKLTALRKEVSNKRHGKVEKKLKVMAFPCRAWPELAADWSGRTRKSGWPGKEVVKETVAHWCHVIPAAVDLGLQPGTLEHDTLWQYSFALPELFLTSKLSQWQLHVFHELKVLLDHYFLGCDVVSTTNLKHLFLYACEEIPEWMWWTDEATCLLFLLDMLLHFLKVRRLPHYFMPAMDLICNLSTEAITTAIDRLQAVRKHFKVYLMVFMQHHLLFQESKFESVVDNVLNEARKFKKHKDLSKSRNECFVASSVELAKYWINHRGYMMGFGGFQKAYSERAFQFTGQSDPLSLVDFINESIQCGLNPMNQWMFMFFISYQCKMQVNVELLTCQEHRQLGEIIGEAAGQFSTIPVPSNVARHEFEFLNGLIDLLMWMNWHAAVEPILRFTVMVHCNKILDFGPETGDTDGAWSGSGNSSNYQHYRQQYQRNVDSCALFYKLWTVYHQMNEPDRFRDLLETFEELCDKVCQKHEYQFLVTICKELGLDEKAAEIEARIVALTGGENYYDVD